MDDLAEGLVGILIAALIIVALIYVLVYVVMPVAICYFLGKQFYKQLKRYELVGKSKVALAAIGAASVVIALAIVSSYGYKGIVIVPIAVTLFLVLAIAMLSMWAYTKKKEFIGVLESLRTQQAGLEIKGREASQTLKLLRRNNERIENKYGSIIREKGKVEDYIRELCSLDARTYTIKRREWEVLLKDKDDEALSRHQKELTSALKCMGNGSPYEKIENSLKLCLAKLEGINRVAGRPASEITANSAQIEELMRAEEAIRQEGERVNLEIARNEAAYAAFTSSRIVLD